MPMYEYQCISCGEVFEKFGSMAKCEDPQECITCGQEGIRILSLANTDMVNNVRISRSMGLNPKQIASGEAEKLHPGATWTPKGDMIIHSRKEKRQRMKERGMCEFE